MLNLPLDTEIEKNQRNTKDSLILLLLILLNSIYCIVHSEWLTLEDFAASTLEEL